ncbi:MAG: hypothetical protein H0V72_02685 [Bradyrhizobium sp.]|nr:hypothetical protein [Bradyrhizobium sp.]
MRQDLWTPTEDAQLRTLALAGFSLAKISKQIGRAKSGVWTRSLKLQIAIAKDQNGTQKRALFKQLPHLELKATQE